ncbi:MAG: ABC-2 family transporter protein [Anaerolineae bacterium]|nr:ABC-2 family transporter protein [Anaerolineae bacterium]
MLASIKVIQTTAKQQLQYRTAVFAGLVTNIAWGIFRYYLINAFFSESPSINGFTQSAAQTYVPLTQGLMVFLNTFGSMEISQAVRQGDVAVSLLRPMSFLKYWMSYYAGKSFINLLLRSILLLLVFHLLFPIGTPATPLQFFFFLVSLTLSWLISHLWIIVINLSAFWVTDATGVLRMVFAIQQLLTGMLFPLRILPNWFQEIVRFTPFPSMLNTPIEIFTNIVGGAELTFMVLQQLVWVGLLYVGVKRVYRAGIHQLEINGG